MVYHEVLKLASFLNIEKVNTDFNPGLCSRIACYHAIFWLSHNNLIIIKLQTFISLVSGVCFCVMNTQIILIKAASLEQSKKRKHVNGFFTFYVFTFLDTPGCKTSPLKTLNYSIHTQMLVIHIQCTRWCGVRLTTGDNHKDNKWFINDDTIIWCSASCLKTVLPNLF